MRYDRSVCGRTVFDPNPIELQDLLELNDLPDFTPSFNIAPTDPIPVVKSWGTLEMVPWGFARRPDGRPGPINLKSEGRSFERGRCLVVVSGFYEWKALNPKQKQPYFIHRSDGHSLIFAGVTDRAGGCVVLTKAPDGIMVGLHDRMPVVLERAAFRAWLDPANDSQPMIAAASADGLTMHAVGPRVGSVKNNDRALIEPVREIEQAGLDFGKPRPRD